VFGGGPVSRSARPLVVDLSASFAFGALSGVNASVEWIPWLCGVAVCVAGITWFRPGRLALLPVAFLAGLAGAAAEGARMSHRCTSFVPHGTAVRLLGRFESRPVRHRAEFRVVGGLPGGCTGLVGASLRMDSLSIGKHVEVEGWWRAPAQSFRGRSEVVVERVHPALSEPRGSPRSLLLAARIRAEEAVDSWFGEAAPVVDALLLARRGRLDPEVREAFARAGTAHLLAISGFHVGVIAGLLFGAATLARLGPQGRVLTCSLGTWVYVALIGAPHSATRAALLITMTGAGLIRGQPTHRWGALATALLIMLIWSPRTVLSPGLQLSFAGAAGLLFWRTRVDGALRGVFSHRRLRSVRGGLAAGVAATLPTLPLVAWHFDEVSTIGVPMTLLTTGLVALIVIGVLIVLLVGVFSTTAGLTFGGGVEWMVQALLTCTEVAARLPGASVWVSRPLLLGAVGGIVVASISTSGRRSRLLVTAALAVAGGLAGPMVEGAVGTGRVEIVSLDVGQGDAVAVRSPKGRWVVVDAGPRSRRFDAGRARVVPFLKQRGVRQIEALILTHPDLDHIGGAISVLENIPVRTVIAPGLATAREAHLGTLAAARARGIPWVGASALDALELDGMSIHVLWPDSSLGEGRGTVNESSVVFSIRFGAFAALFTGDASSEIEARIAHDVQDVDVLKVGHHGSATSTGASLLERSRPEIAVISVGRANRYGHPHPSVLSRLERADARVLRTDRHGTIRIRADRRGRLSVRTARSPPFAP
jgi:competence protein ComEC